MRLFDKLIKSKKLEPRTLRFTNYIEKPEKVDFFAEKIFNDLAKSNKKKERSSGFLKYRLQEIGVQENNYAHFRLLEMSKEFSEKMSQLIRFARVNSILYSSDLNFKDKEIDAYIVELTEINRLIIHAVLRCFNFEKGKEITWNGEFDISSELDNSEIILIEVVNKVLHVNSRILDVMIRKNWLNKDKVLTLLKVNEIKSKRIPRVL